MNNPRNLPYVTSLRSDGSRIGDADQIHRFIASPAGVLVHYTDNQLRAIVPPQRFDNYVIAWPEAAQAVAELRRARKAIEDMAEAAIAKARASSRKG